MTNEGQRKWVAEELRKVRLREDELATLLRRLVSDSNFKVLMQDDDRPDLIELKK